MVAITALIVAAIFAGSFTSLQVRVGPYDLYSVDMYEAALWVSSTSREFEVLGVSVYLNLTHPRLLVDGENFTFAYSLVVGDAPTGWRLNITRAVLEGSCIQRVDTVVNKVLTGRQQLADKFNVKVSGKLYPGYTGGCGVAVRLDYNAVFGENRASANFPVNRVIPMKSRELPLGLSFGVLGVSRGKYGEGYVFNASIRVRNTLNSEIIVTSLKYCRWTSESSPENIIGCFWYTKTLSSIVLKPGEERVLTYENAVLGDKPNHVTFVVQYLYGGGRAENWLVLRVVKVDSTVGSGTATTRAGIVTATAGNMATQRVVVPPLFQYILIVGLPIVIGIIAISAVESRRSRKPPGVIPPEYRKLSIPNDFESRCAGIWATFKAANKYYFLESDERAGIRALHDAVNSLLKLIFDVEGISFWKPNKPGIEISMREKVEHLVRLGWITRDSANYFMRLQNLRNLASHSHENLRQRLTRPEEVKELFDFFSRYIPSNVMRVRALLYRDRQVDKKPDREPPSYIS